MNQVATYASGGPCAGSDTRRMGLDFKTGGGIASPCFEIVPVWRTPLAAQAPPKAFTVSRYIHG